MKEQLFAALLELFHLCMNDPDLELPQILLMVSELEKVGFDWKHLKNYFLTDKHTNLSLEMDELPIISIPSAPSIRIFTREEILRLDTESRGLILELEQQGILCAELREKLIELAMESSSMIISPEEIKWLALKVVAKSALESTDMVLPAS